MDSDKLEQQADFLGQLRDDWAAEEETAVVAPNLPLTHHLKARLGGLKRYRVLLIRGLVIVMVLVITTQLAVRWVTAVNQFDGGPVPLPVAIEQVEDDLLPAPQPPVHP